MDFKLVEKRQGLVKWAQKYKREGTLNEIIDPYLMGKIAPECFMVYVDIATSCVQNRAERRPTMGEVQVCLEHALELQECADAAAAAAGDCNYCFGEYTCNASSGDASPIDMWWKTASRSTTSAEELSLENRNAKRSNMINTNNSQVCVFSVFGLVLSLYCLLLLMEFMVFVLAEKMWEKRQTFPYLKLLGWGIES